MVRANQELAFQNKEKDKRAEELVLANIEKDKQALALARANKELASEHLLVGYRSEMERIAKDLTGLMQTANGSILAIDAHGKDNEWNQ